jgi:YidC/Oxa1 family membrane protein insertase
MQTKNLILFFVLSTLTVIGFTYFQHWKWGDTQRPPTTRPLTEREQTICLTAATIAAGGGTGIGIDNANTAVALLTPQAPKIDKTPPPTPAPAPRETSPDISFGGDGFKLRVMLSAQGASVREVVLNQFQAAGELGLPMWQDGQEGSPLPLHLVPKYQITHMRDNDIAYDKRNPFFHYTLYHYEKPDDAYPVNTLGTIVWRVKTPPTPGADPQIAEFEADVLGQNLVITKTFTLAKGAYDIRLSVKIRPKDPGQKTAAKFRYQLMGAHGLPIEGVWYTYTYRNALIGTVDEKGNAWRDLEDPRQISHWGGGELHPRQDKVIRYAGIAIQYFASVVAVDPDQPANTHANFIEKVRATIEGEPDKTKPFLDDITVRLMTESLDLQGGEIEHKYILYNGPVKVRLLGQLTGDKAVSPELVHFYEDKLQLNTLTDYHSPGVMGSFASSIGLTFLIIKFTNLIHGLIWLLHEVIPWYGLCIIGVTVIVRGCMFPLSRRQAKNTQDMQEKMAKLAPEVKKLQEKYKDDFQALNQARTELYLRHGINPLSTLGGCLLLFLQMPVFLGLYYALQESIHFRLDPFLWIRNLAAPDMLIWWGESIPWISRPIDMGGFIYLGPYFNLLPVVAVALMIVQQQMMTPPPQDEQQAMQMKMMKYMMIFFGLMFYKVAAGLCMYFIASSLWGLCERKLLPKKKQTTPAAETEGAAAPAAARGAARGGDVEANGGVFQKLKDWWGDVLENAGKQQQARRDEPSRKRKKEKKDR